MDIFKIAMVLYLITPADAMYSQLNRSVGHEAYLDGPQFECKCKIDPTLPEFHFLLRLDSVRHTVAQIVIKYSAQGPTIQSLDIPYIDRVFCYEDFDTLDFNFDGYPDISLLYQTPSGGGDFHIWLYNPRSRRFEHNGELSNLTEAHVDWKTKTVISSYQSGASHGFQEFYRFVKGKLVLLRTQETEYKDSLKLILRTTEFYDKGKLQSVKVDTLQDWD